MSRNLKPAEQSAVRTRIDNHQQKVIGDNKFFNAYHSDRKNLKL